MEQGIRTENLRLSYGGHAVIEHLCVHIPKGAVTVIIGANGCGKSTLLKGMARMLKPEQGRIHLDGRDIHGVSSREIARRLAALPQNPQAPEGMTVEELVAYGRFPHKRGFGALKREDFAIIRESLGIAGMEDLRYRLLSDLSGGQRQRAWIAMTLCQKTDFMLLDEPTTYLDMAHQMEILTLLSALNRREGRTVVMVLHELNNASRFADHILAMKDGRVLAEGPPSQVVTQETLRAVYQIEAELAMDAKTGKPVCLSYETIDHG
ncbi:MAG: ABC transporter ATP-binding protein [Spirochaetaceae bacterium]|jgi:iron complex transport system ATP-binding protein|nr:ABC transporter ATP-binding protein [Spirochaetaceae bacterium]